MQSSQNPPSKNSRLETQGRRPRVPKTVLFARGSGIPAVGLRSWLHAILASMDRPWPAVGFRPDSSATSRDLHMARFLRCLLATGLVWWLASGSGDCAAAGEPAAAVGLVVSAGRTMGEPLGDTTRFEAVREGVIDALEDIATMQTASVGIWLYGHRLAWQSGPTPGIDDNAEYLAQSNGFVAISGLLPGDDIEQARPLSAFDGGHLAALRPALDVVRPWGEAPLPAAVRAAETGFDAAATPRKGIILITDGTVSARLARRPASFDDALSACDRHGVPIHVVLVGGSASPMERHALEELARLSEGSLQTCDTPAAVRSAIPRGILRVLRGGWEADAEPEVPGRGKGGITAVKLSNSADNSAGEGGATPPVRGANTSTRVTGVVLHGGKPVPRAKVSIEGVEPDRVTTDREGHFVFEAVPDGIHEIVVEGIARNKIRESRKRLVLNLPLPAKRTVQVLLP